MSAKFPHLGARVSYDGASFSGMQRQPHRHSLQVELERAFSIVLKRTIHIQFSSRTDSGVHALDQWIVVKNGVEMISPRLSRRLLIALNGVLPPTVRVWQLLQLREDFNPKVSPTWKEYHFRIIHGPTMPPLQRQSAVWIRRSLDLNAMKRAIKEFEGRQDFAAFSKRNRRYGGRTQRRILKAQIQVKRFESCDDHREIKFIFRGEGFLHHMVRTMVGTLIDIGDGKPNRIREAFRSRSRSDAGVNAAAQGLTLHRIFVAKKFSKPFHSQVIDAPLSLPSSNPQKIAAL